MTNDNQKKRQKLPRGVRIALRIGKWILFPLLCILVLYFGLWLGYVELGHGDPEDVMEWDTWQHVLDLVFKDS